MEFKQLTSFVAVVENLSFTKAAEKTYTSQPTISAHIRALEEELNTRLIIRSTKNIEITPKGWELYTCASHILELQNNLLSRWSDESKTLIHLGASTIPSAYILPEVLPLYGQLHPEVYFTVHQSDSEDIVSGMQDGLFDVGFIGQEYSDDVFCTEPFFHDRIVLITPVTEKFLELQKEPETPITELLKEPIILREKGSGSWKSADRFLKNYGIREDDLTVVARINDQESIKNLVAGGLGISLISEKAVKNFVDEKRILLFRLPRITAVRNLYLLYRRDENIPEPAKNFIRFVLSHYRDGHK